MGTKEVSVQGTTREIVGALGAKEPLKQPTPADPAGKKQHRCVGQVGVSLHAVKQCETFRNIAAHHHQKRVPFPGKLHPIHQSCVVLHQDAAAPGVALNELRSLGLLVQDKHNAGLAIHQVLRPLKRPKIPFPGISACSSRKRVAHS